MPENSSKIKTFEHLIKILKANGIIIKELDFNQMNIFMETLTSWANYTHGIEKINDKRAEISGKIYIREK